MSAARFVPHSRNPDDETLPEAAESAKPRKAAKAAAAALAQEAPAPPARAAPRDSDGGGGFQLFAKPKHPRPKQQVRASPGALQPGRLLQPLRLKRR